MDWKRLRPWGRDLLLALPRISAGLILATQNGARKFGVPWSPPEKELGLFEVSPGFVEFISDSDMVFAAAPLLFAWLAGFSEVVGALFMAFGLCTRTASFLVAFTMAVAASHHWGEGVGEMLHALAFGWVAFYSLILGSGRMGLDRWIWTKKSPSR